MMESIIQADIMSKEKEEYADLEEVEYFHKKDLENIKQALASKSGRLGNDIWIMGTLDTPYGNEKFVNQFQDRLRKIPEAAKLEKQPKMVLKLGEIIGVQSVKSIKEKKAKMEAEIKARENVALEHEQKVPRKGKTLLQIDSVTGEIIKEWVSVAEAVRELGIPDPHNIYGVAHANFDPEVTDIWIDKEEYPVLKERRKEIKKRRGYLKKYRKGQMKTQGRKKGGRGLLRADLSPSESEPDVEYWESEEEALKDYPTIVSAGSGSIAANFIWLYEKDFLDHKGEIDTDKMAKEIMTRYDQFHAIQRVTVAQTKVTPNTTPNQGTIKSQYITTLKNIGKWITIKEWAKEVAVQHPALLISASQQAAKHTKPMSGLNAIVDRLSSHVSQDIFGSYIQIDDTRTPKRVRYNFKGRNFNVLQIDIKTGASTLWPTIVAAAKGTALPYHLLREATTGNNDSIYKDFIWLLKDNFNNTKDMSDNINYRLTDILKRNPNSLVSGKNNLGRKVVQIDPANQKIIQEWDSITDINNYYQGGKHYQSLRDAITNQTELFDSLWQDKELITLSKTIPILETTKEIETRIRKEVAVEMEKEAGIFMERLKKESGRKVKDLVGQNKLSKTYADSLVKNHRQEIKELTEKAKEDLNEHISILEATHRGELQEAKENTRREVLKEVRDNSSWWCQLGNSILSLVR